MRVCKFGQLGSMPVRGFFPFAAVEDTEAGVTWAVQVACPSSWQIELRRKDDCLNLMASLADGDYGHWAKTINPGETFATPEAYLTAGKGGLDETSQRLLTVHRRNMPQRARRGKASVRVWAFGLVARTMTTYSATRTGRPIPSKTRC